MRTHIAKERVRCVIDRQFGRVAWFQLRAMGMPPGRIKGWLASEFLIEVLPHVYAIGHAMQTREADLCGAVLYAGPGAKLSHDTAAHWRRYIDRPIEDEIQVSTPRQCRPQPGLIIHQRRPRPGWVHDGLPVTSPEQTVLDLAASGNRTLTRKALARLDYFGSLDLAALDAICGKGRRGSKTLRWAIRNYDPRFGRTNSPFEDNYLLFCEAEDVPKPDLVNEYVDGVKVDVYYTAAQLVIEFDGRDNHSSDTQKNRDHRNDLHLRSRGKHVLRYSWDVLNDDPAGVKADVLTALAAGRQRRVPVRNPASQLADTP